MTDQVTVCWSEIPVTDLDAATDFYAGTFGWEMTRDDTGPNPIVNYSSEMTGVHGHLYPGTPAAQGQGPTLHMAVAKLEEAIDRCKTNGGKVLTPPIQIPPGRFVYAQDPDGNSLGLFEAAG